MNIPSLSRWSSAAGFLLIALAVDAGATTYTYNGPDLAGSPDHVMVTFTTTAPLAASTSYLDPATAGVTASSIAVAGSGGGKARFTMPLNAFQVHTDASGDIDSWFLLGDLNTLAGVSPAMTGNDWQAYTMNTMAFIPGSDIGGTGLVMGHYNYDQATQTNFYADCASAPAGCTLAGNGQPYLGVYSGILNPSGTSGSAPWWKVGADPVAPAAKGCDPAGADRAGIAAARASIATNCSCTSFNNSSTSTSRKAYLACVKAQAAASSLRTACASTLKRISKSSVCGYTPGTRSVCLQRSVTGQGVKCAVKPAGNCDNNQDSASPRIQKECLVGVCLDAVDKNGDQVIDSGDDCEPSNGVCGDGIVSSGEDCDDGTSNCVGGSDAGSPCATNAACSSGVCSGNGNRDDVADKCRSDCSSPSCGDGVIDTGETCDDGNEVSGDGCSADCQIEP